MMVLTLHFGERRCLVASHGGLCFGGGLLSFVCFFCIIFWMNIKDKLKQELGKNLKFNEPLKNWTTFRIGGPARYFFMAESIENFSKAIKIAQQLEISYFVLDFLILVL